MSSRLCFATRHQKLAAARTKGFHWGLTTLRRIQRCAGSGFCKPSQSKFCLANVDIVTLASATVQIVITEQVSDSAKIDPLMTRLHQPTQPRRPARGGRRELGLLHSAQCRCSGARRRRKLDGT
jgi:hypothetical protein